MTRTGSSERLPQPPVVVGGCFGGDDSDKAGGEQQPDAVVLTLANRDARDTRPG